MNKKRSSLLLNDRYWILDFSSRRPLVCISFLCITSLTHHSRCCRYSPAAGGTTGGEPWPKNVLLSHSPFPGQPTSRAYWLGAVEAWPSSPSSGGFYGAIPASELSVGSTEASSETVSQPDVSLCPVPFLPLLATCGGLMNTPSQISRTVIPTSKSTFPGTQLWPFCRWGNRTFENYLPKVRKPFIGEAMTWTPNLLASSLPSLLFTFPNSTSLKDKAKFPLLPEASLTSPFWAQSSHCLLHLAHGHGPSWRLFWTVISYYKTIVLSFSFPPWSLVLCLPCKFLGIQVIHYSLCPNSCPHAEHTVHYWAKNVKQWQDPLSSGCVLSLWTGSIISSKDTQPCGFNFLFVFSGMVQGFVTWGMRGWQVILPKKQYQPWGKNPNSISQKITGQIQI